MTQQETKFLCGDSVHEDLIKRTREAVIEERDNQWSKALGLSKKGGKKFITDMTK